MILGIDTSIGTAVAVIERGGVVRTAVESTDPRGHAEAIGTLIESALAEASISPAEVAYVAVGMGPGPFTGLRVGIAAARAFALGRGVPVVPVVSHDAVALELLLHDALIGGLEESADRAFAVVTDARRRELAYTVYRGLDDDGLPVRVSEPALAPRDEIEATLGGLLRRDAERIPAVMLALAAARAITAGRVIAPSDALYLRSPDVTLAPPRTVTA